MSEDEEYFPEDIEQDEEYLYDRRTMWQRWGELLREAQSVGGRIARPITEKVRPLTRADRRRERNMRVIIWTERNRPDVWTPAQRKAALAFYARGLNQADGARELGITFASFRDRLRAAEQHAVHAYLRANVAKMPDEVEALDAASPSPSRYRRRRPKRGRVTT